MKKTIFKVFFIAAVLCTFTVNVFSDDESDWEFYDWDSLKGDNITIIDIPPEPAYGYAAPEITSPLVNYSFGTENGGNINLYYLERNTASDGKKDAVFTVSGSLTDVSAFFAKDGEIIKKYLISSLLVSPVTFSAESNVFCVSAVRDDKNIYIKISSESGTEGARLSFSECGEKVKIHFDANSLFFTKNPDYLIVTAFYGKDGALVGCVCSKYPQCGFYTDKPNGAKTAKTIVFCSQSSIRPAVMAESISFQP